MGRRFNRRSRRNRKPGRKKSSIFTNRRDPNSKWVGLDDIRLNIYERIFGWWHRIPRGATLRWKGGKIEGYYTKNKWPN